MIFSTTVDGDAGKIKAVSTNVDMAHFFSNEIFNYTDFWDFISASDTDAVNLPTC